MKSIFLFITISVIATMVCYGQNAFPPTGNVAIGTTTPSGALSLGASIRTNKLLIFDDNIDISGLGQTSSELRVFGPSSGTNHISFGFYRLSGDVFSEHIRLTQNGNLGIGTSDPDAKLSVNGSIHAKEVKVNVSGWPDYVFESGYDLKPLQNLKAYIEEHKHLPDLPSALEIENKGLNLGEMNAFLVKKIEELTLYLIEKDSQITLLSLENKNLGALLTKHENQLNKVSLLLQEIIEKDN